MLRSRILLLLGSAAALAAPSHSQTLRVPQQFPTIGAAVSTAPSGATILVGPGTYRENDIDFSGKTLVLRGLEGPAATIVDGGATGQILLLQSGESAATRIEGFTFRNGRADSSSGGAIYLAGSSPTIRDCVFEANECPSGSGGAIAIDGARPVILGCVFRGNVTDQGSGGAIGANGTTSTPVLVSGCRFLGNSAPSGSGGAIYAEDGPIVVVQSCVFARNSADQGAGGALGGYGRFRARPSFQVQGSTFSANQDVAIFMDTATCTLADTIVWANPSPQILPTSGVNAVTATFCDIQGGYAGVGNRSIDPLFVAPASDDYRLQASSPLIEAADPLGSLPQLDAYGNPRQVDANGDGLVRSDIGAHELCPLALSATGSPAPGQQLGLQLASTTPIAAAALLLGVAEIDLLLPGLGQIFVDLLAPNAVVAVAVPGSLSLSVPPGTPAGTIVFAQGLALASNGGFLSSNPLRIVSR